jgi:hypothetical protein
MNAPYTPEFNAYRLARNAMQLRLELASESLRAIDGIGSGLFGLTPDHVKKSPEFRRANGEYQAAHKALRELNGRNVKRFKSELARERQERREAMLAERGRAIA